MTTLIDSRSGCSQTPLLRMEATWINGQRTGSSLTVLKLRPILAVIELISFFVRPLSHSIRLAGNMMAGHAVLKVFAAFVPALSIFGILPLAMMVAMTGLEVLVACVQAYIFAILTCIYLNDALHPGH